MSARKDRVPTGRSNISQVAISARPQINTARSRTQIDLPPLLSAKDPALPGTLRTDRSVRTDRSDVSTGEMLRRIREQKERERNKVQQTEINALGDYNAFSRPRASQTVPLRSVFLDPAVNNFPPSKTKTELNRRMKLNITPHPTYDIDCDGWVSQEDYRLAKRFDLDGNGVLDPQERAIAKQVLADEFFKSHTDDLYKFGEKFAQSTHKQNVDRLANSHSFERAFESLKQQERTLNATSAKTILSCMQLPDDTLTRHNYFVDKFDTTAWNDFDAIPRTASQFGLADHSGSRKRLMFIRREVLREAGHNKLENSYEKVPKVNTKRSNLITNIAVENN